MKPRLGSMTAGLAIGISAAVVVACAAGAYFYSLHHFNKLLDNERGTALAQGELMRAALEHQMIENDRSLIAQLVQSFGKEPRVENLLLLDRYGKVQYASRPQVTVPLDLSSPTCQACHRLPPDQRGSSRIIETAGGSVLRTVIPLRNREACHGCHNPAHRINGILLLDFDTGALQAGMNSDLRWMVAGTGGMALVLIAAIAWIVRVLVLKRLQRFETTARQIAAGDLARRVPTDGSDTVSWLATEFNTMADSVTGLLSEVRTQRERVETVINSIDDGIVVLDRGRQVIAANDAFLARTGRGRGSVLGCSCRDLADGICTSRDCPTVACVQTGERQVRMCERRLPDGTRRWEEVHASPIHDSTGAVVQVVEVWRDISDRRAAEARLAESHRLASLGVLASGFSHEMNTPLATVLMCVEAILRESAASGDGERVAENARIARDQVLRCRGITQHFLRMSRGQASAADVIDVGAAVEAVARLVTPTAHARGIAIETRPIPRPLRVRADEADLQHAALNVVLNAVQASRDGGRVVISADEDAAGIHLRVADEGCGIAPEHQARIFEPFFSLRSGGTGLGLFLALSFARRWGGDITVASEPGAGSTFEMRFPSAAAIACRPAS